LQKSDSRDSVRPPRRRSNGRPSRSYLPGSMLIRRARRATRR
jgi:hypothetical protein